MHACAQAWEEQQGEFGSGYIDSDGEHEYELDYAELQHSRVLPLPRSRCWPELALMCCSRRVLFPNPPGYFRRDVSIHVCVLRFTIISKSLSYPTISQQTTDRPPVRPLPGHRPRGGARGPGGLSAGDGRLAGRPLGPRPGPRVLPPAAPHHGRGTKKSDHEHLGLSLVFSSNRDSWDGTRMA